MKLSSASSRLLLIGIAANHLLGKSDALLFRGQETKRGADDRDHDIVTSHQHPIHRNLPKGGWQNSASCKIVGTETVGIYIGGGSISQGGICDTCVKWAEALAAFWSGPAGSGLEFAKLNRGAGGNSTTFAGDGSITFTYVTLTTSEIQACYNGELDSLSLLVMPGGSAYENQDALGSGGKDAITNYLDQGGNYLGFCAGGYYMARGYDWKVYGHDLLRYTRSSYCCSSKHMLAHSLECPNWRISEVCDDLSQAQVGPILFE